MAFESPCSLEYMDTVIPFNLDHLGWIAIQDNGSQDVMCVEGHNGYSFVFYDDTEELLRESIKSYVTDVNYLVKRVSLLEILHSWRAMVYKGERQLIMGCKNYLCDTALSSPAGMLYPHAFNLISYLVDASGNALTDEWGSLICAGSPTRLIQSACYDKNELLLSVYGNKTQIKTEPLIFIAKHYKSVFCEGFTCNVPLALAHSYHARNSKNV